MPITTDDRIAIHELLSLHGHLMDERQFSRLDDLFTTDAVYDLEDFGAGVHHGVDRIRALAMNPGEGNPLAHHVTNVVVTEDTDGSVRVRSKGIGIMPDGKAGSVVYDDLVVKTQLGWRLAYRSVIARRAPAATPSPGKV